VNYASLTTADADTAVTRCKGEITHRDLKQKWPHHCEAVAFLRDNEQKDPSPMQPQRERGNFFAMYPFWCE
jgi:hypothetical protein